MIVPNNVIGISDKMQEVFSWKFIRSWPFGYEKGAFTEALVSKPGKFELANRGTIFRWIGDLPLSL